MPIYYDTSEKSTKLPQVLIDSGYGLSDLEEVTGTDFMIVPEKSNYEKVIDLHKAGKNVMQISRELTIPLPEVAKIISGKFTENQLYLWLESGALLVQRKSGNDFVQSLGEHLNYQIAKMTNTFTIRQAQRIILVTGVFSHKDDLLTIDNTVTNWKYNSFLGAVSALKFKGVCCEFVATDNDIPMWIEIQQNQLLKYKSDNLNFVMQKAYFPPDCPDGSDPLQLMIPVKDSRLCLINISGWGYEKVNQLYTAIQKWTNRSRFDNVPLLTLLWYATRFETADSLKGIGKKLIENARNYCGLKDGENITTIYDYKIGDKQE